MAHDEKPFGEALQALMAERGLSFRALAEITREINDKGLTHSHLNGLATGREKPSARAIGLIADACGVPPSYFAAYRLAEAMRELDPDEVGWDRALENLNALICGREAGAKARRQRARPTRPRPSPNG